ncbi:hypothetical protein K2173_001636 [Erythroxylum novogranatense]|uniref:Ribosomal RNA-processing protein 17 n=1 Tax=Erythroxylum novogranatense TaxID=1862640 RepID=A0AAV8T415_9ROSI|nr:hypothetical protein K2173_001636 [Erythroxylum novogranatense]
MDGDTEEGASQLPPTRVRHIKKRALKNKALHVSFDEKDLRNYVTGFHKRKKKRRKEAQKQQEEAFRRKRIELRKQRKLERDLALNGGVLPSDVATPDESNDHQEDDKECELGASINGTTIYDTGNMEVMVTTSEITGEADGVPREKMQAAVSSKSLGANNKHCLVVSKKLSFKKVSKQKSQSKTHKKRNRKKGKPKKR